MSDWRFDLQQLQHWMQSVITHRDGISAGIESGDARRAIDITPDEIETVINRSNALTSIERLNVYGNAYFARLIQCMRESFPALAQAVGDETFDQFSFDYLQQYPSKSYTLGRLGDFFAQYLQETRPDRDRHERGEVDWPDFLIDLANLEWNIEQVFDGPGVENGVTLTPDQLLKVSGETWPSSVLEPVCCLRLLQFRYPVNGYYTEFRQGKKPATPDPQMEFVALTRRNYVVRRFDLKRPQFNLLKSLVDGCSVEEAIGRAAEAAVADMDVLAQNLQRWFHDWAEVGFFQSISTSNRSGG